MYDYSYDAGFGSTVLADRPRRDADPVKEAVPAASGVYPGWDVALARLQYPWQGRPAIDERLAGQMLRDPAVSSSFNTHRIKALQGGVKLVSPAPQPAWSKRPASAPAAEGPGPDGTPGGTTPAPERTLTPEQATAKQIFEECERSWAGLKGKTDFLLELLEAMWAGCKMAEVTFRVPDEGPDAARYVFDRISVKPNWAWRFVVDSSMKVTGFLCYDPAGGGYEVYSPEKFVWLSWMPRDSDPRGTSLFDAAHPAWNLKQLAWPSHYRHLHRFGSPGLDLTLPPGAGNERYPALSADGTPKNDGTFMTATEYYSVILTLWQAGGSMIRPAESDFKVIEPQNSGDAYETGINLYDRQMKLALDYQTRTSMEAEHGSKADSATAENVEDVVTGYVRDVLSACLYRAFWLNVALNHSPADADAYAPYPTFGNAPNQDRPALFGAAAGLISAGAITPSITEEFYEEVGLPIPDVAADRAAAQEAAQMQAELMKQARPDTPGANPKEDVPPKAPAKGKAAP